jgi:tRNA G26 N,N-dimethylase Trm1
VPTVVVDKSYIPQPKIAILIIKVAGPMWAGPLHNREFVKKVQTTIDSLDESVYITKPRINGFLSLAAEVLTPHPKSY